MKILQYRGTADQQSEVHLSQISGSGVDLTGGGIQVVCYLM